MFSNYIDKLEFNKIIDILCDYCVTTLGKSIAKTLYPQNKKDIVLSLLNETTEATNLIYKKKSPTFVELENFYYIEKMLETGSSLNTTGLLEVYKILKLAHSLKEYYLENNEDSDTSFPILDKYFSMLYINPSIR